MTRIILILLVALILVFLSAGLKQVGEIERVTPGEIARIIGRGVTNRNVLIGVLLEAVFFGALIYLLSQRDVSLIWPLTSLGFVITAFAARFILNEEVSWVRWSGVTLIVCGAMLVTWSEKMKEPKPAAPQVDTDSRRGSEEIGQQ
jgi:drug/metabolite transporter (DMT)-like permease